MDDVEREEAARVLAAAWRGPAESSKKARGGGKPGARDSQLHEGEDEDDDSGGAGG